MRPCQISPMVHQTRTSLPNQSSRGKEKYKKERKRFYLARIGRVMHQTEHKKIKDKKRKEKKDKGKKSKR